MKYFTKEVYVISQHIYLHSHLKSSDRAATFSEEYFKELYAKEEQQRLDFAERISRRNPAELAEKYKLDPPQQRLDSSPTTKEEQKFAAAFQSALAESLQKARPIPFEPEKERQFVRNKFQNSLRNLELSLPTFIQEKVADMRVLAMNHATQEVIDEIRAFCEANKSIVDAASNASQEEFARNFADGKPSFLESLYLHDSHLLRIEEDGADVILRFEETFHSCGYRFRDARILHCDPNVEGAIWLCDEIYPCKCGYEIHALLTQEGYPITTDLLAEFTIQCRDVEINCQMKMPR